MEQQFTSRDVVVLTGITPRQLQWWDERKIVVPQRQGHRRLYSMEDLTEISVICELRRRGFSLQRVRKVIRFLQREFGKRLAQTVSGKSEYHLLTDGKSLYLETSPEQIVDILEKCAAAAAVDLFERHSPPSTSRGSAEKKQFVGAKCSF